MPGETLNDYFETVKTARRAQPYTCYLSIFYPYLGTDLAQQAISLNLVHSRDLVFESYSRAERSKAVLNLEGFSSKRIRFEYIIFWLRVYWGHWPIKKILRSMFISFIKATPKFYSKLLYIRNKSYFITNIVSLLFHDKKTKLRKFDSVVGTRVDVISDWKNLMNIKLVL